MSQHQVGCPTSTNRYHKEEPYEWYNVQQWEKRYNRIEGMRKRDASRLSATHARVSSNTAIVYWWITKSSEWNNTWDGGKETSQCRDRGWWGKCYMSPARSLLSCGTAWMNSSTISCIFTPCSPVQSTARGSSGLFMTSHWLTPLHCEKSSQGFLKWYLSIWRASIRTGQILFLFFMSISALNEKIHSQGMDEACTGR